MTYVIGIDGGGTKTRATAFQLDTGEAIFSIETGKANFIVQYEESLEQVNLAIQECKAKMNDILPKRILLGAAGAHSRKVCLTVEDDLKKRWASEIHVIDDAQLAHTALLKGNDGLLVIAGTGSIVLGRHNGVEWKTGGWGYLLGDEGSGYWISIKALQHATRQLEAGIEKDPLTKAILEWIQGNSVSDIKTFVYSSTKEDLSTISKLVGKVAARGKCEGAASILNRAGNELVLLVKRAIKGHEELRSNMKIAVSGSIFMKNDIVFEAFKHGIYAEIPGCEIIRTNADVCSAVLYKMSMN